MNRSLAQETRALLASARALVAELAEEGVQEVPSMAEPPGDATPLAPDEPLPTTARPAGAAAAPVLTTQPALLATHPWGADPSLEQVRETLGDCTRCRLSQGRTHIVFGDGNPQADLMFVGEGPGETEDRRGLPFVGRAGELLTQMIEKGLGIPRSEVYICNVVKCRPPDNRTPTPNEAGECKPYLTAQLSIVEPKIIVALGRCAAEHLGCLEAGARGWRGRWSVYEGIPVMPTYHPAFLLRTPKMKRPVWEDLQKVMGRLGKAPPSKD